MFSSRGTNWCCKAWPQARSSRFRSVAFNRPAITMRMRSPVRTTEIVATATIHAILTPGRARAILCVGSPVSRNPARFATSRDRGDVHTTTPRRRASIHVSGKVATIERTVEQTKKRATKNEARVSEVDKAAQMAHQSATQADRTATEASTLAERAETHVEAMDTASRRLSGAEYDKGRPRAESARPGQGARAAEGPPGVRIAGRECARLDGGSCLRHTAVADHQYAREERRYPLTARDHRVTRIHARPAVRPAAVRCDRCTAIRTHTPRRTDRSTATRRESR